MRRVDASRSSRSVVDGLAVDRRAGYVLPSCLLDLGQRVAASPGGSSSRLKSVSGSLLKCDAVVGRATEVVRPVVRTVATRAFARSH